MDKVTGINDVILFMNEYAGKKYSESGKAKAIAAPKRKAFNDFCDKIAQKFSLEFINPKIEWQMRSKRFSNYYWNQLKKKEWEDAPQSISIFIQKDKKKYLDECFHLSVVIEMKDSDSKIDDYKKQEKLLKWNDVSVKGIEYRVIKMMDKTENEIGVFLNRNDAIRKINKENDREKNEYIKIQLAKTIRIDKMNEEDIFLETCKAVDELIPAYSYIMSEENNDDNDVSIEGCEHTVNTKNIALNTILYGPPGTGKTYEVIYYALAICQSKGKEVSCKDIRKLKETKDIKEVTKECFEKEYKEQINFVTFHQSYGYEEFIEGIKPVMKYDDEEDKNNTHSYTDEGSEEREQKLEYKISIGRFKEICNKAQKDKSKKYVFIIDEINRGNISKIFGELITLIEDTKRDGDNKESLKVKLPYSGEDFSVPDNVYILGTMNTADRSIAKIDTALRRRFSFVEMMPNSDILKDIKIKRGEENDVMVEKDNNDEEFSVADILDGINERIEILLDREHTIGHAFFTPLLDEANCNISKLMSIFKDKIIPLLQEYFYDDYEKIALVLGENIDDIEQNGKNVIYKKSYENKRIFNCKKNNELIKENPVYEIDYKALDNIETYNQMKIEELTDELVGDKNA